MGCLNGMHRKCRVHQNVFLIVLQAQKTALAAAETHRAHGCVFTAAPAERKENCSTGDKIWFAFQFRVIGIR